MKKPLKAAKTAPAAARSPKKPTSVKSPAKAPAAATKTAPPALPEQRPASPPQMTAADQAHLFEEAMTLFHAQQFPQASHLFHQVAHGPGREMAHASRLHIRMCEHRLAKSVPELSTAEDRYNYAIALINRRELEAAEQQLKQALQQTDEEDHLHYAMALCRGLLGDLQGAYVHLKRAIELQPRNRLTARNDPDFHQFAHHAPVRELLFP